MIPLKVMERWARVYPNEVLLGFMWNDGLPFAITLDENVPTGVSE